MALAIFVVELVLRLAAHGWRFFRDPWSVFDFVIVGIALVPTSGAFSVLRARFGDLGTSLFTLFQVIPPTTGRNIARAATEVQPLTWIFFVVYLLLSTFAVLNLFKLAVDDGPAGHGKTTHRAWEDDTPGRRGRTRREGG